MLPTFLIVALLIISAGLKFSGHHPMLLHFVQLHMDDQLAALGTAEMLFSLLFLFPATSKLGLLLLTGYFGGAIALELPYHMAMGPLIPLALIWTAAFIRQPQFFLSSSQNKMRPNQ